MPERNVLRVVIQERMPPGAREVMHCHRESKQLFYVLGSVLTMRTELKSVTIPVGQAVVVEPPTPHQASNESRKPVDFLVVPLLQVTETDSMPMTVCS